MNCKIKAGELLAALQMANITVDKRSGSALSYVYLGAFKDKKKGSRLVVHSTDSIARTLLRVNCEVEEKGTLIVDPVRLLALLQSRAEDEVVSFTDGPQGNRTIVKVGKSRSSLSSYGTGQEFDLSIFPHDAEPLFRIEVSTLKALLDRTSNFIFRKDGQESLKNVLIRSCVGGYEALATNREVVASARESDVNSPGVSDAGAGLVQVNIPGYAMASLSKILSRNRTETMGVITVKSGDKDTSLYFRTEDVFFGIQLAGAQLPAVDIVFRQNSMPLAVEVSRETLLACIHRSDPFCTESKTGRLVEMELKDASVRLTASDDGGDFEEVIEATSVAAGQGKGRFQVGYISEVLRVSGDEKVIVKLGTAGPNKKPSAMVMAAEGRATYLVGAVG